MDMIAHHYERMHVNAVRLGDLGEQGTVEPMIIGIDEGRASIDATLRDMKWNARKKQARTARHHGLSKLRPAHDGLPVIWRHPFDGCDTRKELSRFKRIVPPSPFLFGPLFVRRVCCWRKMPSGNVQMRFRSFRVRVLLIGIALLIPSWGINCF
jgi:hypothetical protein